jgi:CRP/FNR family transcriptional regulator, nitrogen oxide reductase regulator
MRSRLQALSDRGTGRSGRFPPRANDRLPVSREQCHGIANACHEILYSSEKVIFLQDETVRRVMLVASGAVRMSRVTEAGKETLLRVERPGGWLDDTLGSDQRHSACARAKQACMLLAWEIEEFKQFSRRIPAIERNMTGIILSRLQALQDRFCDLSTRPVPQRLARLVIQLAKGPESTCASSIALSREEMAQMTGTTVFTVSRLLSSWADSEIVTLNRRTVLIEDMDRLQELAEAA